MHKAVEGSRIFRNGMRTITYVYIIVCWELIIVEGGGQLVIASYIINISFIFISNLKPVFFARKGARYNLK